MFKTQKNKQQIVVVNTFFLLFFCLSLYEVTYGVHTILEIQSEAWPATQDCGHNITKHHKKVKILEPIFSAPTIAKVIFLAIKLI